jgi:hypothetical protein
MFFKGKKFSEIGTFDLDVFKKLRIIVRKKCILDSFSRDYEIISHIASGTVSRVLFFVNKFRSTKSGRKTPSNN